MKNNSPWLKTFEGAIEEAKIIPLWGSPPPLSLEDLSSMLAKTFDQEMFSLSVHKTDWLNKENYTSGMGEKCTVSYFSLSPLPSGFIWIMPKDAQNTLMQELLTKDKKVKDFADVYLKEGFYQFVLLKALQTFNDLNPFGNLSAVLTEEFPFPEEPSLCMDISITINEKNLWGRLICTKEAKDAFRTYFTMEKPPLLSDPFMKDLPITMHLEVGSSTIRIEEWKNVQVGDFIVLDRCTLDPKGHKGTALLVLGNTPLFDVRIKNNELKIVQHTVHQEESLMPDEPKHEEEEEEKAMEEEEEKPLWSKEDEGAKEDLISSKDLPITLTVEMERLQMPLEKVTKLKEGNVLPLSSHAQKNLYLTISGKRVAKGELINLGETLGVKILKLGE